MTQAEEVEESRTLHNQQRTPYSREVALLEKEEARLAEPKSQYTGGRPRQHLNALL